MPTSKGRGEEGKEGGKGREEKERKKGKRRGGGKRAGEGGKEGKEGKRERGRGGEGCPGLSRDRVGNPNCSTVQVSTKLHDFSHKFSKIFRGYVAV